MPEKWWPQTCRHLPANRSVNLIIPTDRIEGSSPPAKYLRYTSPRDAAGCRGLSQTSHRVHPVFDSRGAHASTHPDGTWSGGQPRRVVLAAAQQCSTRRLLPTAGDVFVTGWRARPVSGSVERRSWSWISGKPAVDLEELAGMTGLSWSAQPTAITETEMFCSGRHIPRSLCGC
jgi:hypothetical protein